MELKDQEDENQKDKERHEGLYWNCVRAILEDVRTNSMYAKYDCIVCDENDSEAVSKAQIKISGVVSNRFVIVKFSHCWKNCEISISFENDDACKKTAYKYAFPIPSLHLLLPQEAVPLFRELFQCIGQRYVGACKSDLYFTKDFLRRVNSKKKAVSDYFFFSFVASSVLEKLKKNVTTFILHFFFRLQRNDVSLDAKT